jgi:manganese transport protein
MNTYILLSILLFLIILGLLVVIYRLWRQTRRVSIGLDEIAEDTLKELYYLSREQTVVREKDIMRAANLHASRFPAVKDEMLKHCWVEISRDMVIILPEGEKRAVQLIRSHRLWERYLAEKEGLALQALHSEATRREHLTTEEEANRLEAQLGYPKVDPHGDPIPSQGGELLHHAGGVPLSSWEEHRPGQVIHVEDEPPALFEQLALLGITPGAQVEIDERTPGSVLVWSGRQRLALAPAVADLVFVEEMAPENLPLSEIEVGQAARVTALQETAVQDEKWQALHITPGMEIAAVRADPLGDPITYRIDGKTVSLSHIQANQVLVDTTSIREIPIPRRSFIADGVARYREIFARYGTWAVIKRGFLYLGPAFVISVGYMDPGNWGTDIEGGARFGYRLLWVVLMANLMAILMQTLSAKLGIATGKTLPEVSRDYYPRWLSIFLWITAELAAMATDLAEFVGAAVGFNLLFGIPLFLSALITGVVISLILLLERYGFRKLEIVIIGMIAVIGFVYLIEIWLAKPVWADVAHGLFVPSIPIGATLVAVGIIGATVMPHNLYLHSALIQTRVRPIDSLNRKKTVNRMAVLDSVIALNGAFFVNAAILAMSAAVFAGGQLKTYSLEAAHQTLTPLLGPLAGAAFAIALLASGLSSSTTATMAGQVIMEGFLHYKMNVWLRRAITMIPSLIVIGLGLDPLRILVLSQVSLSFQLPFAMIPLLMFTSKRQIMGEFTNTRLTNILALITTLIILGLNIVLLIQTFTG